MKKRKDGLYQKTVTINGKRVYFYSSAPTERQAEKDFNAQLLAYHEKEEKGKLFKDVAEEWEKEHLPKLTYNTSSRYKPHIRYALEFFSGMYIKAITINQVKHLMQSRINKHYAAKTVSHQMSILNMIFEYACINGYISDNPCRFIHVPNNLPRKKRTIPTEEEIKRVVLSVGKPFGLIAYFVLFSGLRRGELLALNFSDIDFKNKTINVNKSLYYVGNTPHIKKPKTAAGVRKIILLDCLAKKLDKHSIGIIFHDRNGQYMKQSYFEDNWNKYKKEAGINITLHQLRHAYASYILHDAGIDVKTAQELMGHADISTTQNIYTQITERRIKDVSEKLNQFTSSINDVTTSQIG